MVSRLPDAAEVEESESIRVAVVGRPNAGKSSVVNRLLGEERLVVTPIAGTTRDAIDSVLNYHGKVFTFVDTAGLRRKAKIADDLEFYSNIRTERAIDRADVCILVVDAERGLHNQDLRIANQAWDRGCGLIILVNKWDLIPEKDANTAQRGEAMLREKAPFLEWVPFLYGSALSGQRIRKVLDMVLEVADLRANRIATSAVNDVLEALIERNAPPQQAGEPVKLLYASQIHTKPPTFVIITNRPDDIPESYIRFLLRGFRTAWGFLGVPIRLKFNRRGDRE
jgi:GTP-binding protein